MRYCSTPARRAALPLFVSLAALGCGGDLPMLPAEPVADALSVSFLLQRGGAPPQPSDAPLPAGRVYGYVARVSDPANPYLQPVWDAKASISEVPLQLRRTESNEYSTGIDRPLESQYNYYTDSLTLEPGKEYRLAVEQGGKRLVATTRMPGDFVLRSVNGKTAGTSVPSGEPLVLAWARSEGAALYAVTVVGDAGSSAFSLSGPTPLLTSDTTASLAFTAGGSSVPVTIEIRAMDRNQYRASAHRDTRAGIEGGYGSFGSVNVKRYRLTLQVGR